MIRKAKCKRYKARAIAIDGNGNALSQVIFRIDTSVILM